MSTTTDCRIRSLRARRVWDSRGRPTIEAEMTLASGAVFDWSGGWVLWPSTVSSLAAFLLVLLLQYTQNRDTRAIQLKLDELIRSLDQARTQLVHLEQLSDEEISEIEDEFRELRAEQAGERRARP
jgi:low affinity Fe/Cu permease